MDRSGLWLSVPFRIDRGRMCVGISVVGGPLVVVVVVAFASAIIAEAVAAVGVGRVRSRADTLLKAFVDLLLCVLNDGVDGVGLMIADTIDRHVHCIFTHHQFDPFSTESTADKSPKP